MKSPERRFRPQMHLLVCTNLRPEDAPLPCCARAGGLEVAEALRRAVGSAGLSGRVWVTQTGCLTFCNRIGATVVAYPGARWFTEVRPEDAPALLSSLLTPAQDP
jgi:(2Fe-2S) ferredoxin